MPPSSPQFTPVQVLQAGRRAESDGKADLAEHFYRHVVEHYGATAEAAAAREGLARLSAKLEESAAPPLPPRLPSLVDGTSGPEVAEGKAGAVADQPSTGPPALSLPSIPGAAAMGGPERTATPMVAREKRRGYRVGRLITVIVTVVGWLMLLAGLALVPLAMTSKATDLLPLLASPAGLAATAGWAALQSLGGLILILLAQAARALFDIAEAQRWPEPDEGRNHPLP